MIWLSFWILLLTSRIYGCPLTWPALSPTTWRVSWNVTSQKLYFENVDEASGYYMCENVNTALYPITLNFLSDGLTAKTIPDPAVLGITSTAISGGPFTVSGDTISGNKGVLQGFRCDSTNNIRSWTTTVSDAYACFGLNNHGVDAKDLCPLWGLWHCNTCVDYNPSCYPCDCGCTSCFGPGPGMCCDAACSSCFGLTNAACLACNPGYYLQPSSTICAECDPACATCTGPGNNVCSSCKDEYYLQPSPNETTCLSTCPDGYYPNPARNKCDGN